MPEVPFHLPQAAPGPGLEAITARQWRELFHRTEVLWHAQYVAPLYKYQTATSMHLGVRPDLRGRGAATGTGSVLAPVVLIRRDLKSIPPSLVIRKVKYIDAKPQVGRYEIVGDVANHEQDITAYPDFGHTIADYEDFEWDATGPTIEDQFLTARRERGAWLVELPSAGLEVQKFTLFAVDADVLICRRADGTFIDVAKPYILRKTPFHSQRIAFPSNVFITYFYSGYLDRQATLEGGATESQTIVPRWRADMPVIAAKVGVEVTGITLPAIPPDRPVPVPVEWLDLNLDARAWAQLWVEPRT